MMMQIRYYILFCLLSWQYTDAGAQMNVKPEDPLAQHLIAPELIMKHQKTINLSSSQRSAILDEIGGAQRSLNELHWSLQDKMETFAELLSQSDIQEEAAMAQLDQVLGTEADIKKAQMTLMIRLKNILSRDQQSKLRSIQTHQGIP